jgi:hypothetical protein
MFCLQCGTRIQENSQFCDNCGAKAVPPQPSRPYYDAPPSPYGAQNAKSFKSMAKSLKTMKHFKLVASIAAVVVIVFLALIIFGGGEDIVGTWYNNGQAAMEINKEGTFRFNKDLITGTYKIHGDNITFALTGGEVYTCKYKVDGDILYMDGETYTRGATNNYWRN